jgi:heterodisulfide reductase subunit A
MASAAPERLVGSVMVVGGGIAGVQAALDLAENGFPVHLVENSAAIGGVMSALDKTFPTNDCSMCILSPKLVECGRHPAITIHTLTDVRSVGGEAGNFIVSLYRRARYIDVQKCIACGLCAEKCPRKVPDAYNMGLNHRKAVYVKYPQAVPLKYAIDREHCIYFEKGKCRACEKFCPTGAVNFDDRDTEHTLNVGSIILAPGFQPFDPGTFDTCSYAQFPNVITSMEFERILSPSGPSGGHLVRPSDGKEPARIAWLQCIGSRNINQCDNSYCSAVCCMYAIKEAVIAKEHSRQPMETAVFFMDMRASGKDFEKYYNLASEGHGVRFVRSRIHSVERFRGTEDCVIRYAEEDGIPREEVFDLVVLSVGLETSPASVDLAARLGISLNEGRFAATSPFDPVATTRPGIYVCGAFQGPKDIPQSVMEASAAAAQAAALLVSARRPVSGKPLEPEGVQPDVKEPRIAVFVCRCGINIGSVVDTHAVEEYARTLPWVVYAEENLFTCSQDTQDRMKKLIREYRINRVVVASCSPRTHEPLFQQTIQEAGLNKYLFELANIRDQDSWVHQCFPEEATIKAKDLVRMAVSKVALQQPLHEVRLPVTRSGLVIGGGVAGLEAGLSLARQGYPVTIVEKKPQLGGHAAKLLSTWDGSPVAPYLHDLIRAVETHPLVTVRRGAVVSDVMGFVGNFHTTLNVGGKQEEVHHGVAVIATGGHSYRPVEYGYGSNPNIYLNLDLDQAILRRDEPVVQARCAVFIQCVGSREPNRPYCSRVCCSHSIENALRLKEIKSDMDVFILYRDIRTYGLRENLYQEARRRGILFVRFDRERKPRVMTGSDVLKVEVFDPILRRTLILGPDILVLASAIETREADVVSKLFKVPLNPEGFFLEAHMKLRPVDFATEGVFVAGLAHWPKPMEECIAQARAAASRAAAVLARDCIGAGGIAAWIDRELCSGCRACEECCPFGAIAYIEQEARCDVNQALCKGCGTCAAACPSEAVSLMGFTHLQLYRQIDEALA